MLTDQLVRNARIERRGSPTTPVRLGRKLFAEDRNRYTHNPAEPLAHVPEELIIRDLVRSRRRRVRSLRNSRLLNARNINRSSDPPVSILIPATTSIH